MRGIDLREGSLSVAKKFQLIVAVPALTVKIQNQITIRLAGMENERIISFATRQHIRPGSPINPIVASQTIDGIAAGGANKIIIARSADNIRACLQLGGLRTRTDQNQTRNAVL